METQGLGERTSYLKIKKEHIFSGRSPHDGESKDAEHNVRRTERQGTRAARSRRRPKNQCGGRIFIFIF